MRTFQGKRYWLVGASEGLGRALAERMSRAGAHLILSARDTGKLQALADSLSGSAEVVACDVSDRDSVHRAAAAAGEIDGLVFLAGAYWPFGADKWNAEQAEIMADVNFTGAVRVLGTVVPAFVERGRGHIVLTGSLAGFGGLPGSIGYSSSKAGLMHLAESMHADLRGSGVDVQLANPGFIRTRLTDKNEFHMPFLMEPDQAAEAMFAHMRTSRFGRSFPTLFSLVFRGSRFLPDALYFRVFGARTR